MCANVGLYAIPKKKKNGEIALFFIVIFRKHEIRGDFFFFFFLSWNVFCLVSVSHANRLHTVVWCTGSSGFVKLQKWLLPEEPSTCGK